MEGETFFVAFFNFFPQKRDCRLVLGTNASWSSAVVSQRSKTWKGGNRNQDTGSTVTSRNVQVGSVLIASEARVNRKVKQEGGVFGGGREKGRRRVNQPCSESTGEGFSKRPGSDRTQAETVQHWLTFHFASRCSNEHISWQWKYSINHWSRTEPTCNESLKRCLKDRFMVQDLSWTRTSPTLTGRPTRCS